MTLKPDIQVGAVILQTSGPSLLPPNLAAAEDLCAILGIFGASKRRTNNPTLVNPGRNHPRNHPVGNHFTLSQNIKPNRLYWFDGAYSWVYLLHQLHSLRCVSNLPSHSLAADQRSCGGTRAELGTSEFVRKFGIPPRWRCWWGNIYRNIYENNRTYKKMMIHH